MNAGWNQVSTVHQQQFLQQTGLSELPAPSAMTGAQLTALTGIVGESTVQSLREADAGGTAETGTIAEPKLAKPKRTGNSALMLAIAKLQMETSEVQAGAELEGIMATRDETILTNEKQIEKINASIESMEESNSLGTASKVLGWIGVGLACAAAIAVTIVSGGAGVPLLIGAAVGLTSMILSETGAMETIVESLADSIQSTFDTSDKAANLAAQILVGITLISASLAASICSFGLSTASSVATITTVVSGIIGGATTGASGVVTIAKAGVDNKTSKVQADSEELSAWLTKLQAIMSEQTEMLSQVLQTLSGNVSNASQALSTLANSQKAIVSNMGV